MSFLSFVLLGLSLTFTIPCVNSDDTDALRNTLSLLCLANKNSGDFSSCCAASLNGASVTLKNGGCFEIYFEADKTKSSLIELFAFDIFVFHRFSLHSSEIWMVTD